jgi:oxygen-independent coproporphyrinogen-3 oxidase
VRRLGEEGLIAFGEVRPVDLSIATPEFRRGLVERYDVPGPRYTSYPTANHFHPGFGAGEYARAVAQANAEPIPRDLSLYVHVPFCASPCFYCGCTRLITRSREQGEAYLARLESEIGLQGALYARDRRARQVHFGGGTPTFLDVDQIGRVMAWLGRAFRLDAGEGREFAIEIDPRTVDPAALPALAELGFNRASFGIQDFDPAVQAAVNRIQPFELTRDVVAAARGAGFGSLNVDLIYGLPRQSLAGFTATLDRVLELAPDRIAAYSYAHLPALFKPQRRIDAAELPDAATKLGLLELTVRRLVDAGYVYIGMDHFARPDDGLARALAGGTLRRNFQGYTAHGDVDIVGMGLSAIGAVGDAYAQNAKTLHEYYAALDEGRLPVVRGIALDADDVRRRALIERLLCQGRIDFASFDAEFGTAFARDFATELAELARLEADGLLAIDGRGISIPPVGRLLMRVPAMAFDARLRAARAAAAKAADPVAAAPRFSKVV